MTLRRELLVPSAFTFARQASNLPEQALSFWKDLRKSEWASATPQNKLMAEVLRSLLCNSCSFRACAALASQPFVVESWIALQRD